MQRRVAALENHLKQVPEDARARILLAGDYAELDRVDDSMRETNLAMTLRANEASILYNAACNYCLSQPGAGCCTEFDACNKDVASTCYQCLTGAKSGAECTADADFTAYNTCKTNNCKTDCGG